MAEYFAEKLDDVQQNKSATVKNTFTSHKDWRLNHNITTYFLILIPLLESYAFVVSTASCHVLCDIFFLFP